MIMCLRERWHAWRTKPTDYTKKPVFLALRSAKSFIVAVAFCMAFTDIFLYGLIVTVIPRALQERIGLSADQAQSWTSILLAAYGAALFVFAPIFGYIADHSHSRRVPLLVGLVVACGATVMLTVGTSLALLVAGRILQGAAAAMVWTVGLALLADTVKEQELGGFLGLMTLALSMGTLLGPLLGGVVYAKGGYYDVFIMAFALLAVDVTLRLVMIEKKIAMKYEAGREGQLHDLHIALRAGDELEDNVTVRNRVEIDPGVEPESRNQGAALRPRLPPVIFLLGSSRLLVGLWGSMVFGVLLTGMDAVLPLFVMQTFGWSSTGSGLIFLPLCLPALLGPFIGRLTDRYGPRFIAGTGFLLALPFYVCLRLVTHGGIRQKVLFFALLLLIGAALALISTPIFTEIIHIVYAKERQRPGIFGRGGATGQAYGLFNMAYAAGTIAGPLMTGYIEIDAGWGTMGLSLGLLSAVTSVPVLLLTGGWVGKKFGPRAIGRE